MTKWLTYLGVLLTLIIITTLSISGTKAGFLIVEDCRHEYKAYSIEDKYSLTFHGHKEPIRRFPATTETMPKDLKWENGMDQPTFTDPRAKKGGMWNEFISTFPQTLRQIGMNANTSFRGHLDINDLSPVEYHPVTEKPIPSLAKEWAVGPDKRTVYYKIDPEARWSDGVPVTADDWIFMLKLHRAPGIVDAWMNTYYSEQIEEILKFDDYTIAIRLPRAKPNVVFAAGLTPKPYHFYGNFRTDRHKFRANGAYLVHKNNKMAIPEKLKFYQFNEQLNDLDYFLSLLGSNLNVTPPEDEEENVIEKNAKKVAKIDSVILLAELKNTIKIVKVLIDNINTGKTTFNKTDAKVLVEKQNTVFKELEEKVGAYKPTSEEAKNTFEVSVEDVMPKWNAHFNWHAAPNTGAYQIEKYMHGKWVLFKRNSNWWADSKKYTKYRYNPEYKKLKLIPKLEIAFEYFRQHQLEAFGLSQAEYWYKKASDIEQYEKGYIYKNWLWNDVPRPSRLLSMNMKLDLLKDKNVRLGIAHALNIQKVIDLVMLGDAKQADTICTGYKGFTNLDLKARKFDLTKATTYLKLAGWSEIGGDGIRIKDGKRLSIKLLYLNPGDKNTIMILTEDAAKAGIEFIPDTYDANSVFKFVQDKKHQLVWHAWVAGGNLFGPQFHGQYHSQNAGKPNNNNFCNYADPETDKLIMSYRNGTNNDDRKRLAREIQQLIHDTCCAIPTYYVPFARTAAWRWVQIPDCAEQPASESLFGYGLYWIDEEMKQETLKAIKEGKTFPKQLRVYDKYRPMSTN